MHSHLSFLLHSYCCSPQKSRSRLVRSPHQINRACCLYDTYSTYPMITISLQEGKASGCRDKLGCHIKRAANTWITLCDGWLEGKHNDDSHIIVPLTPNPSSLRAARHMGKQSRSDWESTLSHSCETEIKISKINKYKFCQICKLRTLQSFLYVTTTVVDFNTQKK